MSWKQAGKRSVALRPCSRNSSRSTRKSRCCSPEPQTGKCASIPSRTTFIAVTSSSRPAVMLNLFGDLWHDGDPDWMPILSRPEARLHLYGKTEPRPGRKMGHVLLLDDDPHRALQNGEAMLDSLAADRSRNQRSSPTGSKRAAGTRLSPDCIARTIAAFSGPATRKAARRQLSSTG